MSITIRPQVYLQAGSRQAHGLILAIVYMCVFTTTTKTTQEAINKRCCMHFGAFLIVFYINRAACFAFATVNKIVNNEEGAGR